MANGDAKDTSQPDVSGKDADGSQETGDASNDADDDCDGMPDDGFSGSGEPCAVTGQVANTPGAQGLTNCLGGTNGCT